MSRSLLVALLVASSSVALAAPRSGSKSPPQRKPLAKAVGMSKGRAQITRGRPTPKHAAVPTVSATLPRAAADPSDPHEQRIAALRERLDGVLRDSPLRRTRVGVEVMTAGAGDVLFSHNADKLFNPASNTKILTTAAALTQLGGDFRYPTALYGAAPDEEGVVHGDVELRGSGDPSLSSTDLADLAERVAAAGVTRIEGAILANGRFRDPKDPDLSVGEQALILNHNGYAVRVRPTAPGHAARIDIEPYLSDYFTVENGVTTAPRGRTRLNFDVRRDSADRLVVIVKGRVNPRSDTVVRRHLGDGALFAAATLRGALVDAGVEMKSGIRSGVLPGATPLLAEHRSAPLSEICRVSNKDSNNFVAEAIFRTVGGERFGAPGTLAKGAHAVDDLLAPLGLSRGSYVIENGSGLTHRNRFQPAALARLLRQLFFDLSVAPEFLSSLAVGGIDGTIRSRFYGDAVGLVRAKTGTLNGVSALSGYVGDDGDVLIFSIFVEGFRHRSLTSVRQAQVRMVQAMLAFLRADKPRAPRPELVQPIPAELPGDDDEDAPDDAADDPPTGGE